MDYIKDKNDNNTADKISTITSNTRERSLKINNFNPMKGSPNLFMTKLQFRLRNYQIECALMKDTLKL